MIELRFRVTLSRPQCDFWLTVRGTVLHGQSGTERLVPISGLTDVMQAAWDSTEQGSPECVLISMSAVVTRYLREMHDGRSDARLVEIRVEGGSFFECSFFPNEVR